MLLQVVEVLATFGTLAAALATFLTVREMKAQREDSLLVEFTLALTSAYAVRVGDEGKLKPYTWAVDLWGGEFKGLPLANVGLSSAKAVRIYWDVDYEAAIAVINSKLAIETDPESEIRLSLLPDRSVSVSLGGSEDERWLHLPEIEWVPYVLPYSVSQNEVFVPVPHRVRRLCELAYEAWNQDGLGDRLLLEAILRVEFEDLHSRRFSRSFEVELRSFDAGLDDTDGFGVVIGEPDVLQCYGLS